jgi:hypothetical protein
MDDTTPHPLVGDDGQTPHPLSPDDIVERLRKYVSMDGDRYAKDGAMLVAANEIERLRKELADWKRTVRAYESIKHEDDIVEDLLSFAEIIDRSKGAASVVMTDGSIFEEAAQEIQQLRVERNGWQAEAAGIVQDISNAEDKIEDLLLAGDQLVSVMRSGSDAGWDRAIERWYLVGESQ